MCRPELVVPSEVDNPRFEIRSVAVGEVRDLFAHFHAYRSAGRVCTYAFAVVEDERPVAAFLWQPPPPNAAKVVCPELPQGVLSLSRMVAVPHAERRLRHISKPLRHQMRHMIDRTRWPILVTYSDESVGHTGHVYKCSGWQKTERNRAKTWTVDGRRVSRYSNGISGAPKGGEPGWAWIQRWEHRMPGDVTSLFYRHWNRVPVPGKTWRSGAQAYTYEKRANAVSILDAMLGEFAQPPVAAAGVAPSRPPRAAGTT